MKTLFVICGFVAYFAIGYFISIWMGGDRSKLSPDVTYLDWLGQGLIILLWPFIPLLALYAFLRDLGGR